MPKDKDPDTRPAQSRYSLKSRASIEATHPHFPPVSWCGLCCPQGPAADDAIIATARDMGWNVLVVTT